MTLSDNLISVMDERTLLSDETFREYLLSGQERKRFAALLTLRAEQLGVQSQFAFKMKDVCDEYNRQVAQYKQRMQAIENDIDLATDARGVPVATINNFAKVIRLDPFFDGLCFNLLSNRLERERYDGKKVAWTTADDCEMRRRIEAQYHLYNRDKCRDALVLVSHENEYHPVKNIIDGVQWDGTERITALLHRYLGCEDTPYTREVSRLIFAGGINRLYNPGCKFDLMPVLIGTKQGEGKSTFVRWLALKDEFFREISTFDGNAGIEALSGGWICEVSELLAMTRTKEQEAVKAYLSRQKDFYRMPYAERPEEYPRQCIFIGTTNKMQFLTDRTGNRRFLPVMVNSVADSLFEKEDECKAYILQCWAEAKAKYDKGQLKPYASLSLSEQILKAQSDALEEDWRVGKIEAFLEDRECTCVLQLWQEALGYENIKPTRRESNDITLILQGMQGWVREKNVRRDKKYGIQQWWVLEDNATKYDMYSDFVEI